MAESSVADVLVVGGGGAGLAAAIEAAAAGCTVTLAEKEPALGGSTAWSVGSISVAGTRHQARAGIRDDPQAHFEDLEVLAGAYAHRDNHTLRRLLVEHLPETFGWLESLGLVFVGPMEEPPHRCPRMHNVVPSSGAFPARLGRAARARGVEIRLASEATELSTEGAAVNGATLRRPDGRTSRIAARAVVLAGGDFSANPRLLGELASPSVAGLRPVNPSATGAGIELGRRAGGLVVNGDIVRGPVLRFLPPPAVPWVRRLVPYPPLARLLALGFRTLPAALTRGLMMRFLTTALGLSPGLLRAGAVLVNREGRPFAEGSADPAADAARQPGGRCWLIFDQRVAERFCAWPNFISTAPGVAYAYLHDYRRARPDVYAAALTLEALAQRTRLPRALAAHLAEHRRRRPGRNARNPFERPPYYALGPLQAYVVFTDGGLAVNERLQVLDAQRRPLPGLFAAGSNGQGGLLLEGHGHHLGWAFVSGRLAGREAAAHARRQ